MADSEAPSYEAFYFENYFLSDLEDFCSPRDALAALAFIDYMLYDVGVPVTFVGNEYDGSPMIVDGNELSLAGDGKLNVYGTGVSAVDALLDAVEKSVWRIAGREKKVTRAMLLRRLWKTIKQLVWMK